MKSQVARFGTGSTTGVANVTTTPLAYVHVLLSALRTPDSVVGGRQDVAGANVDCQQLAEPSSHAQSSIPTSPPPPSFGRVRSLVASLVAPSFFVAPPLEQPSSAAAKIVSQKRTGRA